MEFIIIFIFLCIIIVVTLNSCSHIDNLILMTNNNIVRFLMILIIIGIGKYNINIGGLIGLLFLIMINKANHIEGLENNNNKYNDLNLWLGLMLINPIKYLFYKEQYNIKQELQDIKLSDKCKEFSKKYEEIMDNDIVDSIFILLLATKNDVYNIDNIPTLFQSLKYEDMIKDFENYLKKENKISKEKTDKIVKKLLPFLKKNKECLMELCNKVITNKLTKEYKNTIKKKNETDNNKINEKKITKQKLIEKSIKDGSVLECDDEIKKDDDCNNGNICSKGYYCVTKEKGIGNKYLCSPFINPVVCEDRRFSCPTDSKCVYGQKCKDYNGNLTNQVMNSDGLSENIDSDNKFITKIIENEAQVKSNRFKKKTPTKTLNINSKIQINQLINKNINNTLDQNMPIAKKFPTMKNSSNIYKSEYIDNNIHKSIDYIPISKKFKKIDTDYHKKNYHNPSYTAPIVDCGIDKHDFYRNENMCPDCK